MMKIADYSTRVSVDQLDRALRAGGFDGVFHYLSGNFARRLETQQVISGIRALGWPQLGIDVPTLNAVDGSSAVIAAMACGFGLRFRLALDIEPSEFDADPEGWAEAADRWCDSVRSKGMTPGIYGVDRTVAACANHAEWIWRAKPDQCDPAGPGLAPDFFAGRRMVQCGVGTWEGIEMDVSYSQFTVEASMLTPDEHKWLEGLFYGWFRHDDKLDEILTALRLLKPIDVDALAAALVDHLPADADAQAVAKAVVDTLAARIAPTGGS